jgi:LDH2 family malate/lactate/ureidoglycolate dehydrogenase
LNHNVLKNFIKDVFLGLKVPEHEAEICAEVLITADKFGIDSHGIGRLKTIYYDRIKSGIQNNSTKFDLVKDNCATAVVDGNNGMGHYIAKKSMDIAIEKAQKYGLGMVAVRNSTHYGIAGYYALMAAEKGMIGITGTNARPSIAPTFGVENMLGTNPLTFGMPTDEEFPFMLDCATSTVQRGKIEVYDRLNKPVPEGWVIDHEGKSKSDAKQILVDMVEGKAALTPLGGIGEEFSGYKGYGYATVVEILSAALQAGSFLKMLNGIENGQKVPYRIGHFFIAVNVENFIALNEFKKITGDILRELRNSKKMPGCDRIYTAGEKEYLAWIERQKTGIPVPEVTQNEMKIMMNELNISGYDF